MPKIRTLICLTILKSVQFQPLVCFDLFSLTLAVTSVFNFLAKHVQNHQRASLWEHIHVCGCGCIVRVSMNGRLGCLFVLKCCCPFGDLLVEAFAVMLYYFLYAISCLCCNNFLDCTAIIVVI